MNINKRIVFFLLFIAILYSVPVWAGQGWYLMTPPGFSEKNSNQPLSKWDQNEAFSSAPKCEEAKRLQMTIENNMMSNLSYQASDAISNQNKQAEAVAMEMIEISKNNIKAWATSRCIASDDPRLKP